MMKGLNSSIQITSESAELAKKQFPTMAIDDLKATLDRSFSRRDVEQGRHHQPGSVGDRKSVATGDGILKKYVK